MGKNPKNELIAWQNVNENLKFFLRNYLETQENDKHNRINSFLCCSRKQLFNNSHINIPIELFAISKGNDLYEYDKFISLMN